MKIEKLSKDNIKEFIRDMKFDNVDDLELDINKKELYGIKKDNVFCLGFNSLSQIDTIALLYYGVKLSNNDFYECIDFLNRSLVVENHLIIDVYDEKYMKLLEDKYKCKELIVSFALDGNVIDVKDISDDNVTIREKFVDIEMKSIKYYTSKNMIMCNLVKQNIQDENVISGLHNNFVKGNVNYVNFTIFPDSLDYFISLGYQCMCKSYVIRND